MRVSLIATVRDVEPYLPHSLFVVDEVRNRCNTRWPLENFYVAFFENDSADKTLEHIRAWARRKRHVRIISHAGLDKIFPKRTQRLAFGRNELVGALREENSHGEIHRVIIMDMDDVCAFLDVDLLFQYLLQDFTGVFVKCSNTLHRHSDLWALRGFGKISPVCSTSSEGGPCWEKCPRLLGDSLGVDKQHLTEDQLGFRQGAPAVEVESCFNHLAIYNGQVLLGEDSCRYDGMLGPYEECEHVPLARCMRKKGYSVLVEPDFLVRGLAAPTFYHRDLARAISSRNLPLARGIFSWSVEYCKKHTDEPSETGFFERTWTGSESWVWVRSGSRSSLCSDITMFAEEILPVLTEPIVLLTGDGNLRVPADLPSKTVDALLNSPYVSCWLAENCQAPGSYDGKLQPLPKGLDVGPTHSSLITDPPPPRPRSGAVIIHCAAGHARRKAGEATKTLRHVKLAPLTLASSEMFHAWKEVDFVAFLEDGDADSHRTWEALCLNRIPIIKKSSVSAGLFLHLPVILSEDPLSEVWDVDDLVRKATSLPSSSYLDLTVGTWLGCAAGRGSRPIWERIQAEGFTSTRLSTRKIFLLSIFVLITLALLFVWAKSRITQSNRATYSSS